MDRLVDRLRSSPLVGARPWPISIVRAVHKRLILWRGSLGLRLATVRTRSSPMATLLWLEPRPRLVDHRTSGTLSEALVSSLLVVVLIQHRIVNSTARRLSWSINSPR